VILVTALVPEAWQTDAKILFVQAILTRPGTKRVALVVPVEALAGTLTRLTKDGARIEHVHDY
jgi:hypothetical protein